MTSLEQKQVTKLQNQVGPNKYDAVVRLDLFVDVFDWNRGWKMAVYQERLQQLAKCSAVRVAPIGVFNAGKTWLINKLCGGDTQLLSATDEHTEGLSIKLSHLADDEGRLVCFLDTAGLNSPVTSVTALGRMLGHVKMDPMKAMEEMLQELKRHENFIRQVAFEFAHVYLLVVGQISHRDQLEMLQLVQLAEQCGGTKKHVVVVHNLKTMTYDDFCSKDIDVQTKVAYRDSMANVFNLRRSQVEMTVGDSTEWIDQLQLYFGSDNHAVDIRHVFLTKEEYKDGKLVDEKCKNAFVIQYLRNLIKSPVPVTGHILRDIARASTKCALSMARLPSGMPIEIRYHQTRNVLLAGGVPQKEIDELKQWTKEEAAVQAHAAAKEEAQAALAEGETLTEEQIEALRVKAVTSVQHPEYDGETLQPLGEAVVARPVALGAVSATNGDGHAKFNVARKRVLVGEMPMWAVLVHIAVPGLAADQLGRVKAALKWEYGMTMEALTPQAPETLKINFKACVVAMAAKQAAALNQSGRPTAGALGGVIQVNTQQRPIVIEAGNRPFPAEGTAIGAAKEALREDGSFELDVLVHTKVENCVWEVEPVVNYAQGVLSVMVIAEPSDEDLTASANNWSTAQQWNDPTLIPPCSDDLEVEFNNC